MAKMLTPLGMCDHVAVCVNNHIIVLGGIGDNIEPLSLHNIWMYNMYTEQWGKHVIPDGEVAPPGTTCTCAVEIAGDIYMFGGKAESNFTNALWKLTRTSNQCFEWRKGIARNKITPSPRHCHSGWAYAGKLWSFGGSGESLTGYLKDHGDFNGRENNQLLCFDPHTEEWGNLKPSGTVPEPRTDHATTITADKVWMYGGYNSTFKDIWNEFYHLNMVSLTWTEIQIGQLKPKGRDMCSLNAPTQHHLVLHSRDHTSKWQDLNDTWILDLQTLSWRLHEASCGPPRIHHTGSEGMNSSVVIIGGEWFEEDEDGIAKFYVHKNSDFSVRLEPKSLLQLAIQKTFQHQDVLPWEQLPNSLKRLFLFPVTVDDADEQ